MSKKRGDVGVRRTLGVNGDRRMEKGFGEVGAWRRKGGTLMRGLLERGFVPGGKFERIEMINGREREEFVECCNDVIVLDISQTSNMEDKIGATAIESNLKAGAFDVTR